ncbi:GSCOCT00014330001.2-RA-CDS [Cotesia congregata]|uniref:Cc_58b n=1 Tax=Cotesia congregata TaxID=51543 RepID=A0A8J2EKQ9_COTCN|nr:GSCOCT00014330001.2-RA-CDS [Cotesia congregata]CAG5075888.1 Cc_58b [Cotesia congregata]
MLNPEIIFTILMVTTTIIMVISNNNFDDCKFVNLRFDDHEARNLKVSILSNQEVLETLDLKESDGLLADFSTPVVSFSNETDKNYEAYEFEHSTIAQFAPNLGYFTLYRDQPKMAALVYSFRKPTDFSLDGNIGHYVLRHLPNSVDNSRYIYIKLLDAYQALPDAPHEVGAELKFDLGAAHLDTIIVEMVVLIDSQESNTTPTEMIKKILMYYNYIDMLYCNFERPKVGYKVVGIVIPKFKIGNSNSEYITSSEIKNIQEFIERQKKRFSLNNFQLVTVMTQRLILLSHNPLKVTQASKYEEILFKKLKNKSLKSTFVYFLVTVNEHKICETGDKLMMIWALDVDFQAGHGIWVSQMFSKFAPDHFDEGMKVKCRNFTVNVQPDNLNLMTLWPSCVIREYSNYFKYVII